MACPHCHKKASSSKGLTNHQTLCPFNPDRSRIQIILHLPGWYEIIALILWQYIRSNIHSLKVKDEMSLDIIWYGIRMIS